MQRARIQPGQEVAERGRVRLQAVVEPAFRLAAAKPGRSTASPATRVATSPARSVKFGGRAAEAVHVDDQLVAPLDLLAGRTRCLTDMQRDAARAQYAARPRCAVDGYRGQRLVQHRHPGGR